MGALSAGRYFQVALELTKTFLGLSFLIIMWRL
jgi:hypothetical protein